VELVPNRPGCARPMSRFRLRRKPLAKARHASAKTGLRIADDSGVCCADARWSSRGSVGTVAGEEDRRAERKLVASLHMSLMGRPLHLRLWRSFGSDPIRLWRRRVGHARSYDTPKDRMALAMTALLARGSSVTAPSSSLAQERSAIVVRPWHTGAAASTCRHGEDQPGRGLAAAERPSVQHYLSWRSVAAELARYHCTAHPLVHASARTAIFTRTSIAGELMRFPKRIPGGVAHRSRNFASADLGRPIVRYLSWWKRACFRCWNRSAVV